MMALSSGKTVTLTLYGYQCGGARVDWFGQAHGRKSTGGPDIKHRTRRLVPSGAGTVARSTRWHDDGSQ